LNFFALRFDSRQQKYYHPPLMSAPAVIDALEFARSAQESSGSVRVSALQRLEDLLYDSAGSLSYDLRGGRDDRNRPLLALKVSGGLHLQCQRCLGLLDYPLEVVNTLLVVPAGAKPEDDLEDPDAPDTIEANEELDVVALVEDEVLLALPLAPRHPEGECASRFATQSREGAESSAFQKLAALKRPANKH
jgi:uncharacterized protein